MNRNEWKHGNFYHCPVCGKHFPTSYPRNMCPEAAAANNFFSHVMVCIDKKGAIKVSHSQDLGNEKVAYIFEGKQMYFNGEPTQVHILRDKDGVVKYLSTYEGKGWKTRGYYQKITEIGKNHYTTSGFALAWTETVEG